MTQITVSADCGNSPKRKFLKDFNIASAKADVASIAEWVSEDITWEIVGDQYIQGKAAFMKSITEMKDHPPTALNIKSIITHGKEGAANGEITMPDGKCFAYCDVYEFTGAKGTSIKSISSYVIEIRAD